MINQDANLDALLTSVFGTAKAGKDTNMPCGKDTVDEDTVDGEGRLECGCTPEEHAMIDRVKDHMVSEMEASKAEAERLAGHKLMGMEIHSNGMMVERGTQRFFFTVSEALAFGEAIGKFVTLGKLGLIDPNTMEEYSGEHLPEPLD